MHPRLLQFCLVAALLVLAALPRALATDGQPILDLGIVNWLDYQKRQLISEVRDVKIENGRISHRLDFLPDVGNKMERAYTTSVIRAGERWGAEFHGFGRLPFHCTVHPEERGEVSIIL